MTLADGVDRQRLTVRVRDIKRAYSTRHRWEIPVSRSSALTRAKDSSNGLYIKSVTSTLHRPRAGGRFFVAGHPLRSRRLIFMGGAQMWWVAGLRPHGNRQASANY